MRVAQFIDTNTEGGAETIVLELCRELRARAIEPVLLHFGSDYLQERGRQLGIEQHVVPAWRHYKSVRQLPLFALALRRLLRELDIDLVHSHLYGPIVAAAPACMLAGIPHIGTLHDVHIVAERPARIHLLQLAAWLGTRLVSVSRHMERFYRDRGRFSERALRTIYNGTRAAEPGSTTASKHYLGLTDADTVITCVGRLASLKNHKLLLQAFADLDHGRSMKLLIAGDGPLRLELEQMTERLEIASQVRFLGRRDDVQALLAASDIFALASATEGLSCSVLEAMAAGLPTVVTEVGGNPELVLDGVTGYLSPPGDAVRFRDSLQALVDAPALRRSFGLAARQRTATLFSFAAMVENYLQLYAIPPTSGTELARRDG